MTVFADIAGHIAAALAALPDFPAVRSDVDIAMPQSKLSDASVNLGRSVGSSKVFTHTDWQTAIEVRVCARAQGNTTAATRREALLAQVIACLSESNAALMAALKSVAAYAINLDGNSLIDRDTDQLDTAVASATYLVVIHHRTIGTTLNPAV